MYRQTFTIGLMSLAATLSACDGNSQDHQTATQPDTPPRPTNQAQARDLTSLDVCALMSDQLVGQLLDNSVTQPGRRQDWGRTAQGCEYGLGHAEQGTGQAPFEYVFIYISPAGSFGSMEDALDTDRGLMQEVSGQAVAGLGDQAFAIDNQTEHSTSLHLLQDNLALEIKANNLDHTRKLAEALVAQLAK